MSRSLLKPRRSFSQSAIVMYIEHAHIMVKDGRVIYLIEFKKCNLV